MILAGQTDSFGLWLLHQLSVHLLSSHPARGMKAHGNESPMNLALVLQRGGEALDTRGELNVLCLCIKLRDTRCSVGSTHFPAW